jgi:hypothetical protein
MSHFSTIKTELRDRGALIEALRDLGHQPSEGERPVRGYRGQTVIADLAIAQPEGTDIGFRWNGATGSYELVADLDLWKQPAPVERFLARRGQRVPVTVRAGGGHRLHWPLPAPLPLVSVIIPTRDRGEMLRRCIDSLQDQAQGSPPTELLLIDNGSRDPATLTYLAELAERPGVRLLRRPGPFNFAAFNNEAAQLARGEVLAFLNNDVEALRPGWLRAMVAEAVRPGIGAVGARLLFDDGTVQHAGVLLGIGGVRALRALGIEPSVFHMNEGHCAFLVLATSLSGDPVKHYAAVAKEVRVSGQAVFMNS